MTEKVERVKSEVLEMLYVLIIIMDVLFKKFIFLYFYVCLCVYIIF
jgi:hypothetical protein